MRHTNNMITQQSPTRVVDSMPVSTALDGLVLRRMRTSALRKWRSPNGNQTADRGRDQSRRSNRHSANQQAPSANCPRTSLLVGAEHHDSTPEPSFSCPLCYEDKARREVCVLKACSHEFCRDCIGQWTSSKHSGVPTCPMCRLPLTLEEQLRHLNNTTISLIPDDDVSWIPDDDVSFIDPSFDSPLLLPVDPEPLTVSPRLMPWSEPERIAASERETEAFAFMDWAFSG